MVKLSPLAPKGGFPKLPVVRGVSFSAGAAGVKYSNRNDVMLARIEAGATVAGVFTKSSTRSGPVLDCQAKLSAGVAEELPIGLVVNSGNANAFTGAYGDGSVHRICDAAAKALGTDPSNVFTASTGVIGERLPDDQIAGILSGLSTRLSPENAADAAQAIMTTDTFAKGSGIVVDLGGHPVSIAGFAKGSGMIAPDMATMLVYIFTDATVPQAFLQSTLSDLTDKTFNAITVDSDTSTSDSLMLFATGQSDAPVIDAQTEDVFVSALHSVMLELAHQVVKDGEGASKFVEVRVTGAADDQDARKVASAIANSPLVKTAIAGEDPNWGRVVMAVGKSGAVADRDRLSIWFGDILVAENGWVATDYKEQKGAAYMQREDLQITVDLGLGSGADTMWTCDFTHQYISINADYRS